MASRTPKPPSRKRTPRPVLLRESEYRNRLITAVIVELQELEDWFTPDDTHARPTKKPRLCPAPCADTNLPLEAFYGNPHNLAVDQLEQLLLLGRTIRDMAEPVPTITNLRDIQKRYKAKLRSLKKGLTL